MFGFIERHWVWRRRTAMIVAAALGLALTTGVPAASPAAVPAAAFAAGAIESAPDCTAPCCEQCQDAARDLCGSLSCGAACGATPVWAVNSGPARFDRMGDSVPLVEARRLSGLSPPPLRRPPRSV